MNKKKDEGNKNGQMNEVKDGDDREKEGIKDAMMKEGTVEWKEE